MKKNTLNIAITVLTFIWVGLVLGISFMEAPLKFTAPNITRELGLGIGKIVFTTLNRIELVIALTILASLISGKYSRRINISYSIPMVILALQSLWLLPVLDNRIDLILAGEQLPASHHHLTYIVCEVVLILSLGFAGISFMKKEVLS